jgi:DNA-binding NarL/FixJ family response regulator
MPASDSGSVEDPPEPGDAETPRGEPDTRRTLLVVSNPHTISDALIFAVEREFPWIVVERVASMEAACMVYRHPVSLILIEAALLERAEELSGKLMQLHPTAQAAVIEMDSRRPSCSLNELFNSSFVRSMLPMDLNLDVWLSVIRLMLRGGQFLPSEMLYARGNLDRIAQTIPGSARLTADPGRQELTRREIEVLELVSEGLQNKSIAAVLGLSEHTVKIHIHNIISKLRAHNRTEAAAWFRDHRRRA